MFHDSLKKLKEKLQKEQSVPEKEEPIEIVEESSEKGSSDEEIDILSYVDSHGVVNKDAETSSEKPSSKPDNPVLKQAPKQKKSVSKKMPEPLQEEEDLSVFDSEPESVQSEMTDEIDILAYMDSHGVVNKDRESLPEAEPVQPKRKEKKAPVSTSENDLSVFDDEPDFDPAAGAEDILDYVDTHGIELKAADDDSTRQSGEENLVRSRRSTEKQIDLHGMRARDAELLIRRVFRDAKKRGYQQVLIIHGRGKHSTGGDPILKRMVVDLLEGPLASQVASFYFAPMNEGGGGATRVVLR